MRDESEEEGTSECADEPSGSTNDQEATNIADGKGARVSGKAGGEPTDNVASVEADTVDNSAAPADEVQSSTTVSGLASGS